MQDRSHLRILPQEQLPYGTDEPNSGHAGSETSEARAKAADRSGKTRTRQQQAIKLLLDKGADGCTWKELSDATGMHHGASSGALSVLHKAGTVARLRETRNNCKVYVLPAFVNERRIEGQGQTSATALLDEMATALRAFVPLGCGTHHAAHPNPECRNCMADAALRKYEARS